MSEKMLDRLRSPDVQQEVAALRESEERFRNAFVQAPLPQSLADADGRYVAANAAFCDLLGYSPAELFTLQVSDLTHPADWARNAELLEGLVTAGRPAIELEKRYLHKDGSVVHVRIYLRLIYDDAGAARYGHAIVLDLSGQRAAEAALAASEARLHALLEHTEDLVLLLGSNGAVRYASPGCDRVAPAFARPGASVFDPLDASDAFRLRAALSDVVLEGATERIQVRGESPEGYRRTWDVRLDNRLRDPVLEAVVATFRDVSGQVRTEYLAEGAASVLRMVLAGASRREALDTLARMVESTWPTIRATVLVADWDSGSLRHGAAPSMPAHFVHGIDGLPIAEGAGVCGTAAFRDAAVVVEDVRRDPLLKDYRALLHSVGAKSLWSLPLHDGQGQVVGTLALYGTEVSSPTPEQWRLAQRLADLASLVIAGPHVAPVRPASSEHEPAERAVAELTHRERAVLRLIALGHTNQEIADILGVSVRTVETQRAAVTAKSGAVTRAQLVRLALDAGLLHTELD